MTKDIVEKLEQMRYKYLHMKHISMTENSKAVEELVNDMTLICHVLKRLLDRFEDSL